MIRIKPYLELSDPKKAFHIYLYNAAIALPFPIEDIFLEGEFWDPNFAAYNNDLGSFKISKDRYQNRKEIQEQIKQFSVKLYKYLYVGNDINPQNLRTLLTSAMDDVTLERNGILEILEEVNQTKPKNGGFLLDNVFRYNLFSKSSRKGNIYEYVKMLGVEVCPYCNRMFTSTIESTDEQKSKSRPQLDHYRNKDDYPFLALSILNLIPCCGVCNLIKGKKTNVVIYPFQEELGLQYHFRTNPKENDPDLRYLTGASTNFSVELVKSGAAVDTAFTQRAENSIQVFRLNDLYQSHVGFLSDIFSQRYIFTDEYCEELKERFPDMFDSVYDVKRLLYLRSIEPNEWGKRPLSKLTHDIDEEISELQRRNSIVGL